MVRKNTVTRNLSAPGWLVTDEQIADARQASDEAAEQLAEAGRIDVSAPQWASRYETALSAANVAAGRLDSLLHLQQAQAEQASKRAALVAEAMPELGTIGGRLTASRDQVAAAAAAHLRALVALDEEVRHHNDLLQVERGRIAGLGLAAEHGEPEGTIGRGVRLDGRDWLPVPADGVAANAVRQVFAYTGSRGLLSQLGRYRWRPGDVENRRDGLVMPVLPSAALLRAS